MINLFSLHKQKLKTEPFSWAFIDGLFATRDAAALARSYPCDHFKTVKGYGGEKDYEYEARSLIGLRSRNVSHGEHLSESWRAFANDFLTAPYREAMSGLTGIDLRNSPVEVNVFHYGPGANLGPHLDLKDKIVTHVLYFNERWNIEDGGCLNILGSSRAGDIAQTILPIVGNSVVLIRSEDSWHSVSKVAANCQQSRRSMTVTFYSDSSQSSMWPDENESDLHDYHM
jgi:SM-20-related protein